VNAARDACIERIEGGGDKPRWARPDGESDESDDEDDERGGYEGDVYDDDDYWEWRYLKETKKSTKAKKKGKKKRRGGGQQTMNDFTPQQRERFEKACVFLF
jgi:hypothetical protein